MADESKVISLAARRRGKEHRAPAPKAPGGTPAAAAEGGDTRPVPARMVWLFCPTCKTLEYTELMLPGGRRHNVCGTMVQEAVVEVDTRAEYTLAELNLRRLAALAELLDAQRARFIEYQERLAKAAGRPLSAYPLTEVAVQSLPVAEVDPLGLLISRFLHQPAARFPSAQPERPAPAGDDPPAG
jgi:hypothetical protein